jgi:hypothetical protein
MQTDQVGVSRGLDAFDNMPRGISLFELVWDGTTKPHPHLNRRGKTSRNNESLAERDKHGNQSRHSAGIGNEPLPPSPRCPPAPPPGGAQQGGGTIGEGDGYRGIEDASWKAGDVSAG